MHARTHTYGRSGHRRPGAGSHRRVGGGRFRLGLGSAGRLRVRWQLVDQYRQRLLRRSAVHGVNVEGVRGHRLRFACRPRQPLTADRRGTARAGGPGLGAWPACSAKLHLSGTVSGAAAAPRSSHKASRSSHRASQSAHEVSGSIHRASRWAHKASSSDHEASRSTTRHPLHTGGRHVAERQAGDYVVRAGDYLSSIAARHRLAGGWQALYALNRSVVGKNPNLILVGQHLRLH